MGIKKVQFDYFQVFCDKKVGEKTVETLYDMTGILEKAQTLTPKKTTKEYRGEKARIQTIEYHKNKKVWELQLLRLRENSPPGIAGEDGTFDIVTLEDGKYVGEFVSVLYDQDNCVLVIHRNANSLTPSGIEEYFNKIIDNSNIKIKLKPIVRDRDVKKIIDNKLIRTISFGIATDTIQNSIDSASHLGGILQKFLKYEGASLKVEISLGNVKRDRSLAPGLVDEAVDELYDNKATSKLQIKLKDTPDTKVEKVDLLLDRVKDIEEFDVDRKKPLKHDNVYITMKSSYILRKDKKQIFK